MRKNKQEELDRAAELFSDKFVTPDIRDQSTWKANVGMVFRAGYQYRASKETANLSQIHFWLAINTLALLAIIYIFI